MIVFRDIAQFFSLSLIVYINGSVQVNDLLGGNMTLPPPLVSPPDESIRGGATKTLLGGSIPGRSQRPGRKNSLSQRPYVPDQGEACSNRGIRLWLT